MKGYNSSTMTPDAKAAADSAHARANNPVDTGALAVAAEGAATLAGHERIMRRLTTDQLASRCGISASRLAQIESGAVRPYDQERAALAKVLVLSPAAVTAENTADNRSRHLFSGRV